PSILIEIPHDKAQGDLQRGSECNSSLLALIDLVFRYLQFVTHKLELSAIGKITNGKDRLEDFLQPDIGALLRGDPHLQEMIVRALLDLDQVWHRRHLGDAPEVPADAVFARERRDHACSSCAGANADVGNLLGETKAC